MFYQLYPHIKIVTGAKRAALYHFLNHQVYSINYSAFLLLQTKCNIDFSLDTLTPATIKFFDTLTKKNIGGFYLEKQIFSSSMPPPSIQLSFVWLELTSQCNNQCLHCYTESSAEHNFSAQILSKQQWLTLLEEIAATGCKAIQFIGGEPLLCPHWRELITKARALNFEHIELFTNATLLTTEDIDFLADNKISIATTLYANNSAIHDTITKNPGSFIKTIQAIQKIKQKNLPLRIASIIMKQNEAQVDALRQLCQQFGSETTEPDVIRPTGRGADIDLLPTTYHRPPITPPFFTTQEDFTLAQTYHPCLAGKIVITETGTVLPCIFARNHILGDLTKQSLQQILTSPKLHTYWQTTKDIISKCCHCEYRYACPDCRPLAQNSHPSASWLAAPDCPYDPYTGIWHEN